MFSSRSTISIPPRFRLGYTAWVLRRREKNAIDQWDGASYSRVLVVNGTPVRVVVSQEGGPENPSLSIELQSQKPVSGSVQAEAQAAIRKLLGVDVHIQPFYDDVASHDPQLKQLAGEFVGMRPPRFPSVFEALVNAIACQQVSLDAGISLLNKLAETFGRPFNGGEATVYAFPEPGDLLEAPEENFRSLGFSRQKTRYIKNLAELITNGEIDLEQLESTGSEEAFNYIVDLHGIGRWSAEYALLRGLGRLEIFPGDDIGGQNNIQNLLGLPARPGYDELREITTTWQPYAGLVYFHLLLQKLRTKGLV